MRRNFRPPTTHDSLIQISEPWPKTIREKILILEIGCGKGDHSIQYCLKNPSHHLIAIERTSNKFVSFQRKLEKLKSEQKELNNLSPVHGEALIWLSKMAPKKIDLFDECFVLYPNPYPKKKQKNLRWAFSPGAHFINELLKPGGRWTFASNLKFYIDELERQLPIDFQYNIEKRFRIDNTQAPRTAFEKKYLERGEVCEEISFRKPSALPS